MGENRPPIDPQLAITIKGMIQGHSFEENGLPEVMVELQEELFRLRRYQVALRTMFKQLVTTKKTFEEMVDSIVLGANE